ncbi:MULTISPECIES: hypothetical protein [Rhodococcus]
MRSRLCAAGVFATEEDGVVVVEAGAEAIVVGVAVVDETVGVDD